MVEAKGMEVEKVAEAIKEEEVVIMKTEEGIPDQMIVTTEVEREDTIAEIGMTEKIASKEVVIMNDREDRFERGGNNERRGDRGERGGDYGDRDRDRERDRDNRGFRNDRGDRGMRGGGDRSDRNDRGGRGDRPDRGDTNDRRDKGEGDYKSRGGRRADYNDGDRSRSRYDAKKRDRSPEDA
eukprot:TRINITY_DN1429_c0_g1_i13.p1 TRINITY_DN1429_c0_g1~~TRINITY_DN1429_c0_g1_i13.p1  ORF type:complete len:182 (+),score=48.97 TRINITY_DN1429_c0_g1_i13:198-743(+)